jgi:hypothetical protein
MPVDHVGFASIQPLPGGRRASPPGGTAGPAVSTATPWLQRRLPAVPWPAVHRMASVMAYVLLSHVNGAGSDTGGGFDRFAVIQVVVAAGLIAAMRVVTPRLPVGAARPR